jgi:hypothetical protein
VVLSILTKSTGVSGSVGRPVKGERAAGVGTGVWLDEYAPE